MDVKNPENVEWLSVSEFAKRLKISQRTIWRNIDNYEIRKDTIGHGSKIFIKFIAGVTDRSDKNVAGVTRRCDKKSAGVTPSCDTGVTFRCDTDEVRCDKIEGRRDINIANKNISQVILIKGGNSSHSAENNIAVCQEIVPILSQPLPDDVLEQILVTADTISHIEPTHPDWDVTRTDDKDRAWAKFEITKAFTKYRTESKAQGIRMSASGEIFVSRLRRGDFCRTSFNTLKKNKIAVVTLERYERILRDSDDPNSPVSLLEGFRFCGRKPLIEADVRNWIKALAVDERNLDPSWIYKYLTDQLSMFDPPQTLSISERTLQLMVKEARNDPFAMAYVKGKESIKNKIKLHTPRINDLLPGEMWESDGHVCNVLVKSPFYYHRNHYNRYLIRPTLIVWRDVSTGFVVGYRVCLTENSDAVRYSLMDSIARYGLPQRARLDNGKSY